MDGIQLGEEMCGFCRERLRIEIPQIVGRVQIVEDLPRLIFDVFGKAKGIASF